MASLPRLTWAEALRKAAHVAALWPALLLPWLSPMQALGVTVLLLLMNLFILPWAARGLYRPGAEGMGALEIILYPAALSACVAANGLAGTFAGARPWYLPVAAAWFALAVIDACIGVGCRIARSGPALPWNARKPVAGVLLGAALAAGPAWFLARWAIPAEAAGSIPGGLAGLAFVFAAAVLAETAWFGVADNLVIPFVVCALLPLVPNPLCPVPAASMGGAAGFTPANLLLPLGFGVLSGAARLLTPGGAMLGAILAWLLMRADPWLFAFLGGFFLLGNLATRYGFARKQAQGIAEARGGRRGAAEVFGAMGLAAWMTPLVHLARASGEGAALHGALLIAVAPLVAKTMDTVSSEIGKAAGGVTVSLRRLARVPPGSEGGMSLAGTLAGLTAAAALAAGVVPLGWGSWAQVSILLAIALAANIFESLWGEYAAKRGLDQGPHTNVLMTLVAAVLGWLVFAFR